ncbi:MAG: D-glycerate dehydrogenase [Thermomicrobiales bacterium]
MKIAVTRRLFEAEIERLEKRYDVELWDSDLPPSPDELLDLLDGAGGALTLLTDKIDGSVLDQRPDLRVVSNLAVGFDNIDVPAATERNVAVCTTPDVLTDTTAEYTIALIFAAAREVVAGERAARNGEWETWYPMRFLGLDLNGATLGVIGFGRIGQRVAELAAVLGMNVIVSDPNPVDTDFAVVSNTELIGRSDIISIHTPLTDETHHLIDARRFEQMKDDAILINTARGPVIDTDALVATLEAGKLRAVALDVTDPEPLPSNHKLYSFGNVIITPHIASATVATRTEMARLAVDNLIAVLEGTTPPNCLNPEVLTRD